MSKTVRAAKPEPDDKPPKPPKRRPSIGTERDRKDYLRALRAPGATCHACGCEARRCICDSLPDLG